MDDMNGQCCKPVDSNGDGIKGGRTLRSSMVFIENMIPPEPLREVVAFSLPNSFHDRSLGKE